MKSYTVLRNLYGIDTKNTSTANLSYGDQIMNDWYRRLLAKADWPFLHRLRTVSTIASTTYVNLPYDVDQIESVFVTVSSKRYPVNPAASRDFFDQLHFNSYTSDIPQYYFVYNGQIGIWPTPATANVISINAKIRVIDLNIADITSTTVTSIANAGTALVVSGGLTSQMVGFWIRITLSTTANTGDGEWYEIASIQSATTATLVRAYGGNSISAGTAPSTISQMPLLPESYHDLPEQYAAFRYWAKEEDARSGIFMRLVDEGISDLKKTYAFNNVSGIIDDNEGKMILNPNLTVSL